MTIRNQIVILILQIIDDVVVASPVKNEELEIPLSNEEKKSKLVKKFFYGDEEKKEKKKVAQEKKKQIEETKAINTVVDQKIEVL